MSRMLATSLRHRRRYHGDCRSSALVIVLCCLVFLTVLVVAFFASIAAERQSAKIYANSSSVKLLADSVVDIVMGQIKSGTRGTDSTGSTLAWASQPGMIRIYNTSGQPAGYFKLYSWADMVGTSAFDTNAAGELPPSDWTNMPALYNDLNDPVSGIYPIVNPAATNSVAGFSIDSSAPTSIRDAAPMPVQWLYVLQDGSLATATGTDGNTVTVASASPNNPIVARIAFWTDDDTCKININTAAGDIWPTNYPSLGQPGNPGSFWDTPRTYSTFEHYLAENQPVHGEFQRYPGHPATTYLTAVFPGLSTNQLYAITPRVSGGGSDSGTLPVSGDASITNKTDRLYASVDEMLFSTNRTANLPLSNTQVQSANFFLTSHSRAPEVNLFNEPRLVTWPVSSTNSPAYRTAYDSLLAFCGTLNNSIYYFQRANSMDPLNDLPATATTTGLGRNRALIRYLQNLTALPVPGFSTNGETFLSKYPGGVATPATDRDQILTETFDYIRALNEQDSSSSLMTNSFTPTVPFPGQVNMQGLPYQSGQITPIYDTVTKTRGLGRFPTTVEAGLLFIGIGQTSPDATQTNYPPYALNNFLYTNYFDGVTATEAVETWSPPPPATNYMENPGGTATNCAPGYTRVQPALIANLFDPSMGLASECPDYFVEVDGLRSFMWQDSAGKTFPMFRQDSTTNEIKDVYSQYGGHIGFRAFTDADNGYGPNNTFNADTYNYNGMSGAYSYPNYGNTLDLLTGAPAGQAVTCLGGTITVKFRAALVNGDWNGGAVGPVVQQVTITFPAFNCPVPGVSPLLVGVPYWGAPFNKDFRDIANRFSNIGSGSSAAWLTPSDCYRGMVLDATKADGRTVAALTNVSSSYFTSGPNYNQFSIMMGGHGMVSGGNAPYYGTFYGSLVPGVSYTTNTTVYNASHGCQTNAPVYTGTNNLQPIANGGASPFNWASIPVVFNTGANGAVGANGVFAGGTGKIPGDWDTGTAYQPDGAYINKADEGDIQSPLNNNQAVTPYFNVPQYNTYMVSSNFFTPNRQMPSPVMFGSLPTGVQAQRPWQTLLFHPDPGGHLGATSPSDHLYLDLFNMPVVEPYPISDPFSTAGKINMNYQIVPFTYITRSTGIQAVLRPEQILAIPTSDGTVYKTATAVNRRYYLDMNETLKGFFQRFASNDIFRSATEICNIWLVPEGLGQTYSTMQSFWNTTSGTANGALTGDNVRERPYTDIYGRLTTKSNTFTVHYHVETLKKIKSTSVNQWVEGTDLVTGDYRGSTTLERYLDTSDTTIPDYATASQPLAAGQAIDNFYKFRVIETKQFNP